MTQLEKHEWCDYWWENAAKNDLPRVLLIGDSITKGYHPHVKGLLKTRVNTDQLATSKAVDNPSFLLEINYIIQHCPDFKYEVIHFNNGLHGFHLSDEDYGEHYERVIQYLLDHTKAVIILALSTPVTLINVPFQLNSTINDRVIIRNQAVERIAEKFRLRVNGLYTPMIGYGQYRVNDGYHYNENGQKAQACLVGETILSALK